MAALLGSTRRSHIVRITAPSNPEVYVDFEVLDAIAFRNENGKELILSLPADAASPYIVDNTGDGNARRNGNGTRRSHMKRVTSSSDPTQFLDIEVLDAIAFRDENGHEWIMNNPDSGSVDVYNTTTGQGDPKSTRRVHDEKVYSDPTDPNSPYMLVERCDTISFRNINGDEMIIVMPSSDDGTAPGRASTVTTPSGYNPASTAIVPPANSDPEIYAFIPNGSSGLSIGSKGDTTTKIACGPLWWPRATNKKGGPWYWYTPFQTPAAFSIFFTPGEYKFVTNPSVSSWISKQALWRMEYLNGRLINNSTFIPFQPFGWVSLDAAILGGEQDADWGLLDYSDTRIDGGQPNGLSLDPCVPGLSGNPDIWQLTGIPAPALIPPTSPAIKWLPGPISTALAAQVATTLGDVWNATSNGYNEEMAMSARSYVNIYDYLTWPPSSDGGATQRFQSGATPPTYSYPFTSFGVPLWDMTAIPPLTAGRFIGGLPIDFWPGETGYPPGTIGINQPGGYASLIGIAQLDPTKWDVSNPAAPVLKPTS